MNSSSPFKLLSGDREHEYGAQTSMEQVRCSAAISQLSDIVVGLERNQQDKDNPHISHIRVLKNRWSGETGLCNSLEYIKDTGRMVEVFFEEDDEDLEF